MSEARVPAPAAPVAKSAAPSARSAPSAIDPGVVVGLLGFLAGGSGLLLATAAMRAFLELFGANAAMRGAAAAAFLVAVALGALLVGTRVDRIVRPLRAFALLQGGACLGAFLGLLLLPHRAGFAALWLAAATCGATLPLLARARALAHPLELRRGASAGALQAASLLGALVGACAGSAILLDALGTRGTWALAVGLAGVAALGAFGLARGERVIAVTDVAAPPESQGPLVPLLPLAFAALVTGFLLLALEFLLFRGIAQATRTTEASRGAMLAAVLGAGALGSALGAWLVHAKDRTRERARARAGLLASQVLLLVAPLVALILLRAIARAGELEGLRFGAAALTWQGRLVGEFLDALLLAGPAAFAAGLAFPCACELARASGLGRIVAALAGAFLLGAAIASLVAPTLLLTRLGLRDAVLAVTPLPLAALVAIAVADRAPRRTARLVALVAGGGGLAALLLLVPFAGAGTLHDPLLFFQRSGGPGARLLAYHEDALANVAVVIRGNGDKVLAVDDEVGLVGSGANRVATMQGVLPALLHPAPKRALALGVGAGVTVAALRQMGCEEVDAVERLPTVVEMLSWFTPENLDLVHDPKVHLHVADPRAFVQSAAPQSYDVIVADLFFPWSAGSGLLCAREQFERVKQLLKPGGLFCQWIPGHQLRWEELGLVGRTFTEVFDGATLWLARPDFAFPILGLVAGVERLELDVPAITKRLEAHPAHDSLARLGVGDAKSFLSLYVADEWFFRDQFDDRTINTSDRARVEFLAARRIESDPVVALHNRRRLFELHEDVVYRMNQTAVDKKELVRIKRELSAAAQSMWQLFDAQTSLLLATANRSLPEAARKNSPEELETHAFQMIGALMREHPDVGPAADLMVGLLGEQLRMRNYARVVEGVFTLEAEPAIGPRPRLCYLRGLAFLRAVCDPDPSQAAQFTKPLEFAVKDLRKALELDPKLVEAQVQLGLALFLLGTEEAREEARVVLAAAREKIVATDRPEEHGLPAPAEAVFAFLSGKSDEAQRWLQRPESLPWAAKLAEQMQRTSPPK